MHPAVMMGRLPVVAPPEEGVADPAEIAAELRPASPAVGELHPLVMGRADLPAHQDRRAPGGRKVRPLDERARAVNKPE